MRDALNRMVAALFGPKAMGNEPEPGTIWTGPASPAASPVGCYEAHLRSKYPEAMPPFPPIEGAGRDFDLTPPPLPFVPADQQDGASVQSPAWGEPWGIREATPEETAAMVERDTLRRASDSVRLFDPTYKPAGERLIAHRVESEAERRTRLLAEWTAHREAAPMAAGRVPGEPMPRSEGELKEQAIEMFRRAIFQQPDAFHDFDFYFSMALTYLHLERAPFYEEHDGNRIVMSMLRSAKDRAT